MSPVGRECVPAHCVLVRPPDGARVREASIVDGEDVIVEILKNLVELFSVRLGSGFGVTVKVDNADFARTDDFLFSRTGLKI